MANIWHKIREEIKLEAHRIRHEDAGADEISLTGLTGSPSFARRIVTDTYTLVAGDYFLICNKATAFTVTLPAATGSGKAFYIKNIGGGEVTADGDGSDTIDGETTQAVQQWDCMLVMDYVANAWVIV